MRTRHSEQGYGRSDYLEMEDVCSVMEIAAPKRLSLQKPHSNSHALHSTLVVLGTVPGAHLTSVFCMYAIAAGFLSSINLQAFSSHLTGGARSCILLAGWHLKSLFVPQMVELGLWLTWLDWPA
ncbi:hypothetical protein TSMEX_007296 [Taenia solium]|eukprot:TsM_000336100 transcript=TsM_000336100 gene=TsM_000336100